MNFAGGDWRQASRSTFHNKGRRPFDEKRKVEQMPVRDRRPRHLDGWGGEFIDRELTDIFVI
jgi:hypothetical protein